MAIRFAARLRNLPDPAPRERDGDEPVTVPLDPETALRALLRVDPDDEPGDDEGNDDSASTK